MMLLQLKVIFVNWYGFWCSSYCRPGSLTCPGAARSRHYIGEYSTGPVCIASIRDLASTTLRVWSNWNCSLRGGHEIVYSGSFGPGRLRGGMFLISMFRWRCSMSGLDFRALGNPQSRSADYHASLRSRWSRLGNPRNSVQCTTTTSTSLNCNGR